MYAMIYTKRMSLVMASNVGMCYLSLYMLYKCFLPLYMFYKWFPCQHGFYFTNVFPANMEFIIIL